jgi:hypothetical protein
MRHQHLFHMQQQRVVDRCIYLSCDTNPGIGACEASFVKVDIFTTTWISRFVIECILYEKFNVTIQRRMGNCLAEWTAVSYRRSLSNRLEVVVVPFSWTDSLTSVSSIRHVADRFTTRVTSTNCTFCKFRLWFRSKDYICTC